MTAPPRDSAGEPHLFTVAEYAALGETESGYTELQEGRVLMSPSPTPRHMMASGELFVRLREQLPDDLVAIQDVDVDLRLVPYGDPGVECHLAGESGYQDAGDVTGAFATSVPVSVRLDLDALV